MHIETQEAAPTALARALRLRAHAGGSMSPTNIARGVVIGLVLLALADWVVGNVSFVS